MSTTHIPARLRRRVVERAASLCEYCLVHQDDGFLPHQVDHIIGEKHGGKTVAANLALSCVSCNAHKGSDIATILPGVKNPTLLFNPRRDRWSIHFELDGARIQPLTPMGEATTRILQLNVLNRLVERQAMQVLGRYPTREALKRLSE